MLVIGGGGEYHDGWGVGCVAQRGEYAVAVHAGQVEIEQRHVRAGGRDDSERLPAVARYADHIDVWFLAE